MKQPFNAILTGTDSAIDGIAKQTSAYGPADTWQFDSLDDSLHIVISRDADGDWQRIAGSEPYLSSWTEEFAEQISKRS